MTSCKMSSFKKILKIHILLCNFRIKYIHEVNRKAHACQQTAEEKGEEEKEKEEEETHKALI